jgi:hypothetical protein
MRMRTRVNGTIITIGKESGQLHLLFTLDDLIIVNSFVLRLLYILNDCMGRFDYMCDEMICALISVVVRYMLSTKLEMNVLWHVWQMLGIGIFGFKTVEDNIIDIDE